MYHFSFFGKAVSYARDLIYLLLTFSFDCNVAYGTIVTVLFVYLVMESHIMNFCMIDLTTYSCRANYWCSVSFKGNCLE